MVSKTYETETYSCAHFSMLSLCLALRSSTDDSVALSFCWLKNGSLAAHSRKSSRVILAEHENRQEHAWHGQSTLQLLLLHTISEEAFLSVPVFNDGKTSPVH